MAQININSDVSIGKYNRVGVSVFAGHMDLGWENVVRKTMLTLDLRWINGV